MEQRGPTVGRSVGETPFRLRAEGTAATKLALITKRAQEDRGLKFNALMHHFSFGNLEQCFRELDARKATGVDGVRKVDYGRELAGNLESLVLRLKQFSYRPQPVRRVLIPRGKGKYRPLGISCLEDKLVQSMAAKLLGAIYEPDFLECSYGFRPKRNCHEAIAHTYRSVKQSREVFWVVDLDIQSYFDTINHGWLMRCLEQRVGDPKFLRLIRRMLKAGVLSRGESFVSEEGTPQGSIVSPVLSNIYLHYVLDLWFERVVKRKTRGRAGMCRYADDAVAFFEYEEDARRFIEGLKGRFGKFGLTLHPEKTRVIPFHKRNQKSGVFDFLGFTFYWGRTRQGWRVVKLRTSRGRLISKVRQFKEWIRVHRNRLSLREIGRQVEQKLSGHYAYYGLSWNIDRLASYACQCRRLLFRWLNRRSQRRSFSWEEFNHWLKLHPLPQPRIVVHLF